MSTETITERPVDGRYTVLRHLADGGMGSVYVARDERLGREVALKVMRADLATDPAFVERFRAEAQSAARLTDQHVVAVYDQGRDGNVVFLAMELVHGQTLRQRLDEVGALTPREALDVMDSILAALSAAHSIGLVHRDVKPENVLIREDGMVKVADFGLARAVTTRTSTALGQGVLGTFAYVSPEQVRAGVADARSDVYAAGLVLFEMLTGSIAFSGENPIHVAFRHVHEPVPPPSSIDPGLPDSLDQAVLAGSATDPDDRPADAGRYRAYLAGVRRDLDAATLDRVPPAAENHTPRTSSDSAASAESAAATSVLHTNVLSNHTRMLPVTRDPLDSGARPTAEAAGSSSVRKRRRSGPAGVLAALAMVAVVAGLAWTFLAGPGALRDVPAVVGEQRLVALSQLEEAGFRTEVVEAFSETAEADTVVATDPGAGQARAITPVTVTVSKGPERYAVPDVTNQGLETATQMIQQANLTVGKTSEDWSETITVGNVVRTAPAAGTPLAPGRAVDVVTSKGREPVELADWTGKTLTEARSALEERGLVVEVGEQRNDDKVAEGRIISQEPAPGTLYKGDTVTFVVSKGPVVVEVPQVRGKQEGEATRILEAAGFKVKVERFMGGVFGTVRDTDPPAGQRAPRGSTVVMTVV